MKVVIRVDASLQIGTGHVMRCLTLATELKIKGKIVQFICRELSGNLIASIEDKGFFVHKLQLHEDGVLNKFKIVGDLFHASWLTVSQEQDAKECQPIIEDSKPDWLIVDHYAIDSRWENQLKAHCKKLMVIDDLADRKHECDLLLDQTYTREKKDYQSLVPDDCRLLLGSKFALLRPEFARWRKFSLQRRSAPKLNNLLISMGGVDSENITEQVLDAIKNCELPENFMVTVVLGSTALNLHSVKKAVAAMSSKTQVKVDASNMAELMAHADLAIGAAGATTWERCCLGLPTLMVIMADNQKLIANIVEWSGAAVIVDRYALVDICNGLGMGTNRLKEISLLASQVTDGQGVNRVIECML